MNFLIDRRSSRCRDNYAQGSQLCANPYRAARSILSKGREHLYPWSDIMPDGNASQCARPRRPLPQCPPLDKAPSTIEELYHALVGTIHHNGPGQYAWPWAGWTGSGDARARLNAFEAAFGDRVAWANFNDNESNDGPMSLNACAGHAFIERVTNAIDALLERAALKHVGPLPTSPREAADMWLRDERDQVVIRIFSSGAGAPKNNVLDCRDFGIGLTADEMPHTILSLNRGNKRSKSYLTGKHGQGASSTFQYADLTVIVCRKAGHPVAFTIVEKQLVVGAKTPTYRYLTVDGKIPTINLPEADFPQGVLVRHIGYEGEYYNHFGDRSIYGLLQRSLYRALLPIDVYHHSMFTGTAEKVTTGIGAGERRTVRGTVDSLTRSWEETNNPSGKKRPQDLKKILHHDSHVFHLNEYDFGGRVGVQNAGYVRISYWVSERGFHKGGPRSDHDVLSNWVLQSKPIIFGLDGQTHAEEPRAYLTTQPSSGGAGLWVVGRQMVVFVDCDHLHLMAKYELFTSTRESLKDTPLKDKIIQEIVRLCRLDPRLKELNVSLAQVPKSSAEHEDSLHETLQKYLKEKGISFERIRRQIEDHTDQTREIYSDGSEGDQEGVLDATQDAAKKGHLIPIPVSNPPTFVRWRFNGTKVKMHPGQKYSWVFETDAPADYWNPEDLTGGRIQVTAQGVTYTTGSDLCGGRARCHFECPSTARPGSKGVVLATLMDTTHNVVSSSIFHIEVIQKPEPKYNPGGTPNPEVQEGEGGTNGHAKAPVEREGNFKETPEGSVLRVKARNKKTFVPTEVNILRPIPVLKTDVCWSQLGWPFDPASVGLSVRNTNGQLQTFYNAENPRYLDIKRDMTRRGLGDRFTQLLDIKLVMHTVFQVNHGFVDEDDMDDRVKTGVRNILVTTFEDLLYAVKAEIELEIKSDKETDKGTV